MRRRARLADETWEPAILEQLGNLRLDEATIAAVVASLGSRQRPITIERGRVERQPRELALEHAAEAIDDASYLARSAELRSQRDALAADAAPGIPADQAVAWLRSIGDAIRHADLPAERADLVHALYERIVVAGPTLRECPPHTRGVPTRTSAGAAAGC